MNWRPRSTTTKRRASTLIEVMVACSIFMGITTVLLTLMSQNRRADEKIANHTDTSQMLLMVFERVRSEVRHARVIGVDAQGRLQFWVARTVNGLAQLTPSGGPDWEPGFPQDPDVALLYVQNQSLERSFQGRTRRLTSVGKDGQISFSFDSAAHVLTLTGAVGDKDQYDAVRNNYQTLKYSIFVANQNDAD